MKPEQREELRAAAEKIIDDGWYEERDKGMAIDACASDYDFIFKANPSAILSLIAQVEALTVPQKSMNLKIDAFIQHLNEEKWTGSLDDYDSGYNFGIDSCIKELRAYFPEATKS